MKRPDSEVEAVVVVWMFLGVLGALLIWSILLASGCGDLVPLGAYCQQDQPCIVTPDGKTVALDEQEAASECFVGHLDCSSPDDPVCRGYHGPTDEVCDLRDNNCDGRVDENIYHLPQDPANTCAGNFGGFPAFEECVDGAMVCTYENDPPCSESDPPQAFYPEDDFPGTAGVGECRFGTVFCQNGRKVTQAPVTPVAEVCGNGLDDDCNGAIDDLPNTAGPSAIVFAVDISGSMTTFTVDYAEGFCNAAQQEPLASSTYAIVVFGDGPGTGTQVVQEFSDATTTCHGLQGLSGGLTEEYQLQGVLAAGRLDWPVGLDRHVVVFTDEDLHFLGPNDGTDLLDECEGSYDLGVFATANTAWEWDPYVNGCGGFSAPLDQGRGVITQRLVLEFGGGC